LWLDKRYVSAQHACLRYTGEHWELKDLGSRNGTYLDGARIRSGEEHRVRKGSKIAFGKLEEEWELIDVSCPLAMAMPLDGGDPVPIDGDMLVLPSSEDPRVTIYRNTDGGWYLEQSDGVAPIENLQIFEVDSRSFRFSCTDNVCKTSLLDLSPALEVRSLELRFCVSPDEEHVELHVSHESETFALGTRSHNYLLLTLARRRLADTREGIPDTSCGWIYQEDLAHDPSMSPPQLNIDVFRIRKQFAAIGVADAPQIIERRPRTGQLRLGTGKVSVVAL
jgi:hypothetical protein